MVLNQATRQEIFSYDVQTASEKTIRGTDIQLPISFCNHPPTSFVFFAPLALMPLSTSYVVFTLASLSLATLGIGCLWSRRGNNALIAAPLLTAAFVASMPGAMAVYYGSYTILIVGLLGLFICAFETNRELLSGFLLTLLFLKPNYAVYAAALVAGEKKYRTLFASAALLIAWLALTGTVVGWQNVFNYPHIAVVSDVDYSLVFPEKMVSLRAVLVRFMPDLYALKISSAISTLAACLFAWLFYKKTFDRSLLISTAILAALFLSPHSHLYEEVVLAICMTLSAADLMKKSDEEQFLLVKRIYDISMVLFPVLSWLLFALRPDWISTSLLILNAVYLGLAIGSLYEQKRHQIRL